MKRMIAITMAVTLALTLPACSATKPIHTTTEVITEPVTTNVPDTLPFPPDMPTAPPATDSTEPTNLEGTEPSESSQPKPTEPPATFNPPEQDTPGATEDPTTPSINPTEPQPTQPKPNPSEPETTEPEVTEPAVTEPPTTEPPATEEKTCKPWCILGEFTTILEPTTTSTGLEVAYCKNCGKEFFNEIPRLISPEKFENVDPRITIRKNIADSTVSYEYKSLAVWDLRSWGGAPIMKITEDDCLDITYFKQDGSKMVYLLKPVDDAVVWITIWEDGSYKYHIFDGFENSDGSGG